MSEISKLRWGRSKWKEKAVKRATLLREFRKKLCRMEQRRDHQRLQLVQEITRLKNENKTLRANLSNTANLTPILPRPELQTLCVLIVISGIVSFRAIPRILTVFRSFGMALLPIPHFTSVIHWTLRVGVEVFSQVGSVSSPWIAIIDCSIDVGTRKALVVLRVSLDALKNNQAAGKCARFHLLVTASQILDESCILLFHCVQHLEPGTFCPKDVACWFAEAYDFE